MSFYAGEGYVGVMALHTDGARTCAVLPDQRLLPPVPMCYLQVRGDLSIDAPTCLLRSVCQHIGDVGAILCECT